MENEIKEEYKKENPNDRFLPIGSVVLLKGGKRELMIVSYCISPAGDVYDKNGKMENMEDKVFDYGACFYPDGMVNAGQLFGFNHDQIEKVIFKGYENENQLELSYVLNGGLQELEEARKKEEN